VFAADGFGDVVCSVAGDDSLVFPQAEDASKMITLKMILNIDM
jgi:hypothetical protein